MKALVKASEAPGIELRDVDMPVVGPEDVLIKVKATAICGSDLHALHSSPGIMQLFKLPMIIGHETCGEVVEVGSGVTSIEKGDRVSPEPHIFCGKCYFCQNGFALNCSNMQLLGHTLNGAFAEYTKVPAHCCWKVPEGYPDELGAILEPLGVAMHGAMVGDINGKSVAVFGCGPIGIFTAGVVTALGATRTFAVEVVPKRLAMVRQLAPDATLINPKEQDAVKTITEATDGLGVDVAIELSGNAEALRLALKSLRREGRISVVGVQSKPVELDIQKDVVLKEATVRGVFGREIWRTWWQVRTLLAAGKFDPLPVITHRFPLTEFGKAFELAASGEAGKILLYPS